MMCVKYREYFPTIMSYSLVIILIVTCLPLCTSENILSLPNSIEKMALEEFYYMTNGPHWFNNSNWNFSEHSNFCEFYGISCICNNITCNVASINLGSNGLYGFIPSTISKFENLTTLDLRENMLEGEISSLSFPFSINLLDLNDNNIR